MWSSVLHDIWTSHLCPISLFQRIVNRWFDETSDWCFVFWIHLFVDVEFISNLYHIMLCLINRFPYDYKAMPAYAITYVAFCISLYFMAFAVVSIDGFFMGICLHLTGCMRDLMDMISGIDDGYFIIFIRQYWTFLMKLSCRSSNVRTHRQVHSAPIAAIRICVGYHNKIFV